MDNILACTIVGSLAVIGGIAGIVLGRRISKKRANVLENHLYLQERMQEIREEVDEKAKEVWASIDTLKKFEEDMQTENVKESSPNKVVNKTEEIKGRIKVLKKKKKDKVKAKKKKTVKGK